MAVLLSFSMSQLLISVVLMCLPSIFLCKEVKPQMTDDGMSSDDSMPTNSMAFAMFQPYLTALPIPEIIDLKEGGSVDIVLGKTQHNWGGGLSNQGTVYGYGLYGKEPSYPGPTIRVMEGFSVNITWHNNISA